MIKINNIKSGALPILPSAFLLIILAACGSESQLKDWMNNDRSKVVAYYKSNPDKINQVYTTFEGNARYPFDDLQHRCEVGEQQLIIQMYELGARARQSMDNEEPAVTSLRVAIRKGHEKVAQMYLKNGVRPAKDDTRTIELLKRERNGNVSATLDVLQQYGIGADQAIVTQMEGESKRDRQNEVARQQRIRELEGAILSMEAQGRGNASEVQEWREELKRQIGRAHV